MAKGNGYDSKVVASFVSRIEALQAELKEHTEGVRGEIEAIFLEASDDEGIPKKALKMVLRERALHNRIRALSDGDAGAFEQLTLALGQLDGTALGEAALAAARDAQTRSDSVVTERRRRQTADASFA